MEGAPSVSASRCHLPICAAQKWRGSCGCALPRQFFVEEGGDVAQFDVPKLVVLSSANVYGHWGNTTWSGTRSWYAGGGVAGTTASGNYYNSRTGTSGSYNAGRQYNAWTGNAWSGQAGHSYNSQTGQISAGQRGTVGNVYTGNYASGTRGAPSSADTIGYVTWSSTISGLRSQRE